MIITRQKYLDMLVAGQGNGLVKAALPIASTCKEQ